MKTTKLRIQTGHPVTADVQEIAADQIRIVDEQDRCLFEVSLMDGHIVVRQIDHHILGENIHGGSLVIHPRSSNMVEIHTPFYATRTSKQKAIAQAQSKM